MSNADVPGVYRRQFMEQLINRYADAILRLCYVYLHEVSQAEDAMQDTFLKVWKSMDNYQQREEGSERAWLMRIAMNVCHDYHRSRWFKYVDRSKKLEDIPQHCSTTLPEDHELLADVYKLPEKYKQVILLYYYQEMTIKETAEVLGIGISTAHKRIKRAQEILRGRLQGRDIHAE